MIKKISPKKTIIFIIVLTSLVIKTSSSTKAQLNWPPDNSMPDYNAVDAEDAIPRPYVPCSATRNPEFHSLRPYQASPCYQGISDVAYMCANTLVFNDRLRLPCDPRWCTITCNLGNDCDNTTAHCSCQLEVTRNFFIDSFDAELPIMGNTEDEVVNSQYRNTNEGIDHYAKVNEYVSWYLNGVNQRAEYDPPDTDTEDGHKLITDFSGPIKKLLSWENLSLERRQQIERAGSAGSPTFDEGGRHDQIVSCRIGRDAASCYTSGASGGSEIRISNWGDDEPPLLIDYEDDEMEQYQEDIIDWLNRQDSTLFQYLPLSSTEDRTGKLDIVQNGFTMRSFYPAITSVSGIHYTRDWPIFLYFSHMEEARELADQLQRTFISAMLMQERGNDLSIRDYLRKHVKRPEPPFCDLVRVRTNPGDTLAPGGENDYDLGGRGDMPVHLTYTVHYECNVAAECTNCQPGADNWCNQCMRDCEDAYISNCYSYCHPECEGTEEECLDCAPLPGQFCQGRIIWEMELNEEMPLADQAFNKLVGSPQSPFQRLFPLIEPGAYPVQGIWDMPGYSMVNYESTLTSSNPAIVDGSFTITDVLNPGGNPPPPKLFYPHIGSIHQYFLDCIQTAVRPEGYGPYCPRGEPCPCEHQQPTPTPPLPTNPPWVEIIPCDGDEICVHLSSYACESNGGTVQYCSETGNCCLPQDQVPTIPTTTPPPLPTGPAGPLNCNDILPYWEYLDIVQGRGPDHIRDTDPIHAADDTDPWPPERTREDDLLYDFNITNTNCTFDENSAADAWALCFANYAVGGRGGEDAQIAMWQDWRYIQDWGIQHNISPIFLLTLAANECAFGTECAYMGARWLANDLEVQLNAVLNTMQNNNLYTLDTFLCRWLQGNRNLANCPPFTNHDGSPNNYGDEIRYWLQIFTVSQPASCQIQWEPPVQ